MHSRTSYKDITILLTIFPMVYNIFLWHFFYRWKFVPLNPFTYFTQSPMLWPSGNHLFSVFMSISVLIFSDSTYNRNHMVFVFFADLFHLYPLSLSMLLQMAFFSFQLFTIEYGVSLYGLYYVEVCSLYTHLLNFVKCFFSIEMII